MKVIEQCAPKVESDIKQFLISSLSGDSRFSTSQIDCHEVIYDLYRCAPQCLSGVAPYLTGELLVCVVVLVFCLYYGCQTPP